MLWESLLPDAPNNSHLEQSFLIQDIQTSSDLTRFVIIDINTFLVSVKRILIWFLSLLLSFVNELLFAFEIWASLLRNAPDNSHLEQTVFWFWEFFLIDIDV